MICNNRGVHVHMFDFVVNFLVAYEADAGAIACTSDLIASLNIS